MIEDLRCPHCGWIVSEGHKCYVIPTSCWQPREGTGIPADAQMYPPRCPDAEFCRANRCCNWDCKNDGTYDHLAVSDSVAEWIMAFGVVAVILALWR